MRQAREVVVHICTWNISRFATLSLLISYINLFSIGKIENNKNRWWAIIHFVRYGGHSLFSYPRHVRNVRTRWTIQIPATFNNLCKKKNIWKWFQQITIFINQQLCIDIFTTHFNHEYFTEQKKIQINEYFAIILSSSSLFSLLCRYSFVRFITIFNRSTDTHKLISSYVYLKYADTVLYIYAPIANALNIDSYLTMIYFSS